MCFWEGAGGGRLGPWGALEQEGTPGVTSQAQLGGPLAPVTQSQSSSPGEGVRGKAALWPSPEGVGCEGCGPATPGQASPSFQELISGLRNPRGRPHTRYHIRSLPSIFKDREWERR